MIAGPKGWGAIRRFHAPPSEARPWTISGFSRQLVFTTFAATQFLWAEDPEVVYGGLRAHNRAIADFCSADPRLVPVGMVSLDDPASSARRSRGGHQAEDRGFLDSRVPRRGRSHPDIPTSIPSGVACRRHGIPFVLHIGLGTRVLPKDYENNGRPLPEDIHGGGENIRVKDYMVISFAPQMFLSALVFDGVFERFPKLRGGAIELGASWVPDFLRRLDRGAALFSKGDPAIAALSIAAFGVLPPSVQVHPLSRRGRGGAHPGGGVGALHVLERLPASRGHHRSDRSLCKDPFGSDRGRTTSLLFGEFRSHGRRTSWPIVGSSSRVSGFSCWQGGLWTGCLVRTFRLHGDDA